MPAMSTTSRWTLDDYHRRADLSGNGLSGDVVSEHHGLRAGALQLLHRPTVWDRGSRHVVEARSTERRILGSAGGHVVVDWHVGLGEGRSDGVALRGAFAECEGHGGKHVSRPVVVGGVRD